MAEWDWETDDFAALWYSDANDRFPRPLAYTSRLPTNDEVAAHRIAVRDRYDTEESERINLAFHTLTTSQLRIEILGESTTLGKGTPREYRIVGARTPYHAVMLTQTAADGTHGRIRCRLFRPEHLAPRLARVLPSFPSGTASPETFNIEDLRQRTDNHGYSRTSARERFERLAERPTDGGGVAGLLTGPIHSRPDPWYTAQWLDIAGDGRYLQQRTREHLTMRPATTADLTTLFTAWIDRVLQRLRETDENW
ncbi:hypothetical protein AWN90_07545 [Nocardia terpenica]|uniref:ESX secretion-associated protein EspG n=2 Tax=Nocardia terpenica TaxID=455432 RepID=A0A164IPE2_9NOCA|nr:hypothetical protein AWN90_07545 [Nocardia terpenica]NQE89361.1 ESX secretion-associated protein EspG [Nocardia terpenica]